MSPPNRYVTPTAGMTRGVAPRLRSHPMLSILLIVSGVLAGAALNARTGGVWGYVAYVEGLLLAVAVGQPYYLQRGGAR